MQKQYADQYPCRVHDHQFRPFLQHRHIILPTGTEIGRRHKQNGDRKAKKQARKQSCYVICLYQTCISQCPIDHHRDHHHSHGNCRCNPGRSLRIKPAGYDKVCERSEDPRINPRITRTNGQYQVSCRQRPLRELMAYERTCQIEYSLDKAVHLNNMEDSDR